MKKLNATGYLNILFSLVLIFLIWYVFLYKPKVLTEWKMTTDKSEYRINDTIKVHTEFYKNENKIGNSERYIQCQDKRGRYSSRYPVKSIDNTTSPVGYGKSDSQVIVPITIENLPRTCRIYVHVDYQINQLNYSPEINFSNEFKVW